MEPLRYVVEESSNKRKKLSRERKSGGRENKPIEERGRNKRRASLGNNVVSYSKDLVFYAGFGN